MMPDLVKKGREAASKLMMPDLMKKVREASSYELNDARSHEKSQRSGIIAAE
jgi:hypothetical protein